MPSTRMTIIDVDAETIFYNYVGYPLVGAYDILNKTITLFPCTPNRITVYQNSKGVFTEGFKVIGANKRGEALTKSELAEANGQGYAPRYLYSSDGCGKFSLSEDDYLSSHEYLTRLMGLTTLKDSENLRGFTVTKKTEGGEPIFDWKSGFLNSPRDQEGKIQREHGCLMNDPIAQREIENIIEDWNRTLVSRKKKAFLPNFVSSGFHFFYRGSLQEGTEHPGTPVQSFTNLGCSQ